MNKPHVDFFVVAHQDDWQLFMGSDVYKHVRDPDCRVVVIVTTAGNGKHADYHWKSRLSGSLLSLCRALPSWSPYSDGPSGEDAALPCGFSVRYECVEIAGKSALRCAIRGDGAAEVRLYLLHVREPLSALLTGETAATLWPDAAPPYRSWSEFVAAIEAILTSEATECPAACVHTADRDEQTNAGDHSDHLLTAQAVCDVLERHDRFRPIFFSMYANQSKPENLDGQDADDQRAAVYAYGGGYMATAAGLVEEWRTGWTREYPVFKARQYPKEHPDCGE